MLDDFHRHRKAIVASKVRALVESQFLAHHPLFRKRISIYISGSVAGDRYDGMSDVDVEIVAHDERDIGKLKDCVVVWKRERGHPRMQIHAPKTLALLRNELEGWNKDATHREVARALIVHDPGGVFVKLQRAYAWYPHDIYREKMHWLFAESIFALEDRLPVALKRKDPFFPRVVSLHVIRLLLNAVLLANKQFPAFDKHLFAEVRDLPGVPAGLVREARDVINEASPTLSKLEHFVASIEKYLIKRKVLPKLSRAEWLKLRPKYSVEIGLK